MNSGYWIISIGVLLIRKENPGQNEVTQWYWKTQDPEFFNNQNN